MKRPWEILMRMPKFAGFLVKKPGLGANILRHMAKAQVSKKPMIRAIEYGVTYNCQAKCDKCSALNFKDKSREKLTMEQAGQVADACLALGNYETNFTGGEPLLDKKLEDLITLFHPGKTFIGINTNGALLDKERIKTLKEAGADVLKISLDSPIADEHDRSRGMDGLFGHVMDVLKIAKETSGIRAHLCLVATKETVESGRAAKTLEIAKANDATLGIVLPAATGGWSRKHEVLIENKHREYLSNFAQDRDVFMQGNIGKSKFVCPCGTTEIYITCYGDIIPCPFIQIAFGNVKDEPFNDIYNRMVNWKQCSHDKPSCASAEDAEFRDKYVQPIDRFANSPVYFKDHPAFKEDQ